MCATSHTDCLQSKKKISFKRTVSYTDNTESWITRRVFPALTMVTQTLMSSVIVALSPSHSAPLKPAFCREDLHIFSYKLDISKKQIPLSSTPNLGKRELTKYRFVHYLFISMFKLYFSTWLQGDAILSWQFFWQLVNQDGYLDALIIHFNLKHTG